MFGESESESPRVPSPWDSFISTPPSPANDPLNSRAVLPKLKPEAEEGNIEYKLQLLSPSPARFARLVTQLKWRLLEGGGQAYYELGVADSGALVGLPRADLEQTLETLEMMAGEIGASVIVVKEIEVPATMAGQAGSETDYWNGKRRFKRAALLASEDDSSPTTATETENGTDTDLATDVDDGSIDGSNVSDYSKPVPFHLRSKPASSSPALSLDQSLALFSMDQEVYADPAENADAESETDQDGDPSSFSSQLPRGCVDLEIASVYKPRPMRHRPVHSEPALPTKHKAHYKQKRGSKIQRPQGQWSADTHATVTHTHISTGEDSLKAHPTAAQSHRRQVRDRRREEKRKALETQATLGTPDSEGSSRLATPARDGAANDTDANHHRTHAAVSDDSATELVSSLSSLHVAIEPSSIADAAIPSIAISPAIDSPSLEDDTDADDTDVFASPTAPAPYAVYPTASTFSALPSIAGDIFRTKEGAMRGETRLIVEALVVRKMSLEEAFLDFSGFSLM